MFIPYPPFIHIFFSFLSYKVYYVDLKMKYFLFIQKIQLALQNILFLVYSKYIPGYLGVCFIPPHDKFPEK